MRLHDGHGIVQGSRAAAAGWPVSCTELLQCLRRLGRFSLLLQESHYPIAFSRSELAVVLAVYALVSRRRGAQSRVTPYPCEVDWETATGETRFGGINGVFQIGAMDLDSNDGTVAAEAEHRLPPYGSEPVIERLQIEDEWRG